MKKYLLHTFGVYTLMMTILYLLVSFTYFSFDISKWKAFQETTEVQTPIKYVKEPMGVKKSLILGDGFDDTPLYRKYSVPELDNLERPKYKTAYVTETNWFSFRTKLVYILLVSAFIALFTSSEEEKNNHGGAN